MIAALAAITTTAQAAKMVDSFIGGPTSSSGTIGGQFNQPRGVAVRNSTGDVYVVDGNNHRIQQFDAANNFVRAWGRDVVVGGTTGFEVCVAGVDTCKQGTTGSLGGEFSSPQGIALDQTTGVLYVSDQNNLRVQKFDASGAFLLAFGKDVVTGNPETGFEVCTDPAACKAGTSGGLGGEFASNFAGYPAVVPAGTPNAGNVIVADPGNRRIQEITPAGTFVKTFGFDVVQPGGTGEVAGPVLNEQQTVRLFSAGFFLPGAVTGGTFTLSFGVGGPGVGTTAAIDWDADAAEVDSALEAITNIGAGGVSVTGSSLPNGPLTVEFTGTLAGTDVAQMTGDGTNLVVTGFTKEVQIATTVVGGPSPAYEVCTVAAECKTAAVAGPNLGQFGTNSPSRVAADGLGNVYAVDGPNSRVQKFSGGTSVPSVYNPTGLLSGNPAPTDVAIGVSNRVLVVKPNASNERRVLEFTSAEALFDTHVAGAGITSANGLGSRATATGRVYLSSTQGGHRVYVLDDDGAPPAIGTVLGASNVETTTATVQASVNSNSASLPTNYRLEISRNGLSWDTVSSGQVPAGTTPQAISGSATGLRPNTSYRVRVVSNKTFGNVDVPSAEVTFTTDAIPPSITNVWAVQIEDTSVRFQALINPHSTETRYRFEWGQGDFANKVPVPDAFLGSGPSYEWAVQDVTGLIPSTEYQFRVVATSVTEGATISPTETFTTRADPTPPCPNVRTGASANLPDCRAFELVSPPYKVGGIGVGAIYGRRVAMASTAIAAYDGERFVVQGILWVGDHR